MNKNSTIDRLTARLATPKGLATSLFVMLVMRLVLAYQLPMTNDEAYYWDWALDIQWSYLDHPPGVSWITWLSNLLGFGHLKVRLFAPIFHLVASLFLLASVKFVTSDQSKRNRLIVAILFLTQLIPGFSLWGMVALPDTGLYLFLSIVVFLSLKLLSKEHLNFVDGITYGLAMGLAGDFKYHALPVAGGMALGLLISRFRRKKFDLGFWISVIIFGLVATLPVWIWNLQNDYASIRFQSDHGFKGLSFDYHYAARAWLGQLIFLTPLVGIAMLIMVIRFLKGKFTKDINGTAIALSGFIPLFLIIESVAPFKQTLPHWVIPGFWVLIPFYALFFDVKRLSEKLNAALAVLLSVVLPLVIALTPVANQLLASKKGDPGPLKEVSLWPYLADYIERQNLLATQPAKNLPEHCKSAPQVAGLRWFWSAQMRYHLTGHPRVLNFDYNHYSYYSFRDQNLNLKGCPIKIFANRKHIDHKRLSQFFTIVQETRLNIPFHEKMNIMLLEGYYK